MTDLHLLKSAGGHKYGCVLLRLSETASEMLCRWAYENIPDADLAEDGRDKSPHCTVLYGLTQPPAEAAQTVAAKLATNGPVAVPVGEVSIFETPKYDVVKVDVGSPGLRRMNRLLKQVPHVDTHPEFKPHITLAYVKPGAGKKYIGMKTPLYGDALAFARAIYSAPDKSTTIVRLGVAPAQRLVLKSAHDVSGEPRDDHGKWTRQPWQSHYDAQVSRLFGEAFEFKEVTAGRDWDSEPGHALISKAHQAFLDISEVTGLPLRFCSLNGRLKLMFAGHPEGSGPLRGEYNADSKSIALFSSGARGWTVAHEWAHALDHFMAGQYDYDANKRFLSGGFSDSMAGPVVDAMKEITRLTQEPSQQWRSMATDAELEDFFTGKKYYSRPEEMFARAFQSYVSHKLKAAGKADSPALDWVDAAMWAEAKARGLVGSIYPEEGSEYEAAIAKAFDGLFGAIKETRMFEKALARAEMLKALKLHGHGKLVLTRRFETGRYLQPLGQDGAR